MPDDIFLEVLGRLLPIDLLQVARASRILHSLLISPNATQVWKRAFWNIAKVIRPPHFLEGMKPLFYTNYLFGQDCQLCGRAEQTFDHEVAQIRYCSRCLVDGQLISIENVDGADAKVCYQTRTKKPAQGVFILRNELFRRMKEYKTLDNEEERSKYVKRRLIERVDREKFGSILRKWRKNLPKNEEKRLAAICRRREDLAKQKLAEEGYVKLAFSHRYQSLIADKLSGERPLGDGEWSRLRGGLIDSLLHNYERDTISSLRQALNRNISTLTAFLGSSLALLGRIIPAAGWFARQEPLASFFQSNENHKIYVEHYERFMPDCLKIVEAWRTATDAYLLSLINEVQLANDEQQRDISGLQLGVTFFGCMFCDEVISYPDVLIHKCFTRNAPACKIDPESSLKFEDSVIGASKESRPFTAINMSTHWVEVVKPHSNGMCPGRTSVFFDQTASRIARELIFACGEDPELITRDELNVKDPRVECLPCSRLGLQNQSMPWTTAVIHFHKKHFEDGQSEEIQWSQVESTEERHDHP
ncbi:hypothetical protein CPB83DRAFT_899438 [Crepidotus variabilis]|uniref:F-box domain-containing protein n=1 Tax=Crepidotus variabilis TaxID=179855 RepID=A0A9P6E516_9AGAR|nr:hypothetical protein CPB83DRAFT_899438 [Crepidotus variabilis]